MERKKASRVYLWLWLSPLLTGPTFLILWFNETHDYVFGFIFSLFGIANWWNTSLYSFIEGAFPVLISALWHLVLLKPARNKENTFVRWHGKQALALAGLRTAVPVVFSLFVSYYLEMLLFIPIVGLIWLVGNIWGQRQARRGDCSLARWLGHGDELPGPEEVAEHPIPEKDVESLMKIIRFSHDQEKRARALEELKKLGMVEDL